MASSYLQRIALKKKSPLGEARCAHVFVPITFFSFRFTVRYCISPLEHALKQSLRGYIHCRSDIE